MHDVTIRLHDKQADAYQCLEDPIIKIIIVCSGIQGGKTTFGSVATNDAITKFIDPNDNFILAAPTYKIMQQAAQPKFLEYSRDLGEESLSKSLFKTRWGSTVYYRTATDPESCEGIPDVRFIWLDEGGMVSKYFWENLMGRAAVKQAKIVITTTPYSLNWLAKLVDDCKAGKRKDVALIQFRSIDNPYFPKEEYYRQRDLLDLRRFAMKYDGQFGKMEGLVFEHIKLVKSFKLIGECKYYAGIDWGFRPDPFVITIHAITPEGVRYRVSEFYKNGLTISDIVTVCQQFKTVFNIQMFFADPSNPANIEELNRNGCPTKAADNSIRYGLDQMIELFQTNRFVIFEDSCPFGVDEYNTYHYPQEKELGFDDDSKEALPVDACNHGIDADRYTILETNKIHFNKRVPIHQIETKKELWQMTIEEKMKYLKSKSRDKSNVL